MIKAPSYSRGLAFASVAALAVAVSAGGAEAATILQLKGTPTTTSVNTVAWTSSATNAGASGTLSSIYYDATHHTDPVIISLGAVLGLPSAYSGDITVDMVVNASTNEDAAKVGGAVEQPVLSGSVKFYEIDPSTHLATSTILFEADFTNYDFFGAKKGGSGSDTFSDLGSGDATFSSTDPTVAAALAKLSNESFALSLGTNHYSFSSSPDGKHIVVDPFKATLTGDFNADVPEPATWAMMIVGLGLVGFAARRRQAIATA